MSEPTLLAATLRTRTMNQEPASPMLQPASPMQRQGGRGEPPLIKVAGVPGNGDGEKLTAIPTESMKAGKSGVQAKSQGLLFKRRWTKEGVHPFEDIVWEKRTAKITNEKGEVIFEQGDVEVPQFWSQTAANIVAQKYFRGKVGSPERETSVKQMVTRVARTIAGWGRAGGYFAAETDAQTFEDELTLMLVTQRCAFNSPVWFNVGVKEPPQCSACFILSIRDSMDSILEWIREEGMIFKGGSGSGINLSPLRSSKEALTGGGIASGPISFMRGADASAGAIKSGGTTRRAAKMVILNADHPDILEFIRSKAEEEKKAWILGEHGYDMSLNGSAWHSIQFQNANNSVRATDAFMQAVAERKDWHARNITDSAVAWTRPAGEVMQEIADAAWQCGDPGMQFDTTINRWNPCPHSGRINASNPCSEYMFLDDTACNLASLNLMKFRREDGEFDPGAFAHGVDVLITAMEIIVGNSGYPTPAITQNSFNFRPLGIGYSNLGSVLMTRGLPYDSDEGRNYAAAITALMSGQAYRQSALIARDMGPFKYYPENREPFLNVINMHRTAAWEIREEGVPEDLMAAARMAWDEAYERGYQNGFRNAQISVVAPTGTISFLMDCDTTGIEPEIALVRYKWLVGGGMIKLVNNSVPEALRRLGYTEDQIRGIMASIEETDTLEGAPSLLEKHLPIFDCAFKAQRGVRSIPYMGHVRMMAAVQPFISGAISKTVNMPEDATPDNIAQVYMEAWRLGLKAIAIYRDGCKKTQPLTTKKEAETGKNAGANSHSPVQEPVRPTSAPEILERIVERPLRKKLSDVRNAVTHKFTIGGHEGYLTVGLYEDGMPGEMFITMNKEGSTLSGLLDSFAVAISFALQYGVPLKFLVKKFAHVRFEPSGYTSNDRVRIAKSIVDYIFRWMAFQFLSPEDLMSLGLQTLEDQTNGDVPAALPLQVKGNGNGNGHAHEPHRIQDTLPSAPFSTPAAVAAPMVEKQVMIEENFAMSLTSMIQNQMDAPICATCGSLMVRNASCYKCLNCGDTSGCS